MAKLEVEIPDLVLVRLTALALARNEPIDHLLAEVIEKFVGSGQTRREIRQARRKARTAVNQTCTAPQRVWGQLDERAPTV